MDKHFWRSEAAMLRREGQHMFDLADEMEAAAREAPGAGNEPEVPEKPSVVQIFGVFLLAGVAGMGLAALAWWHSL